MNVEEPYMSAKKTARSLSRQMTVFGLLGGFVAIGYSRLSHYSDPHGMLWTFFVQGGIGFGIGALLGLIMHQFRDSRISTGAPPREKAEGGLARRGTGFEVVEPGSCG